MQLKGLWLFYSSRQGEPRLSGRLRLSRAVTSDRLASASSLLFVDYRAALSLALHTVSRKHFSEPPLTKTPAL